MIDLISEQFRHLHACTIFRLTLWRINIAFSPNMYSVRLTRKDLTFQERLNAEYLFPSTIELVSLCAWHAFLVSYC